jgi:hypothetical protein
MSELKEMIKAMLVLEAKKQMKKNSLNNLIIFLKGAGLYDEAGEVRELSNSGLLYHGSTVSGLKSLKPMPSAVLDGESAVFATPERWMAISHIGSWTDSDIEQGVINGEPYMLEKKEGAFDRAYNSDSPGSLYSVSSEGFSSDSRLMREEKIRTSEVNVIDEEEIVDTLSEMESLGVKIIRAAEAAEFYKDNFLEAKKHMKESLGLDMTKRRELEYTSFVLDSESRKKLRKYVPAGDGWVEKNHHMTLISPKEQPRSSRIPGRWLGSEFCLTVNKIATTDNIVTAMVDLGDMPVPTKGPTFPHVTIAVNGVSPVASNELTPDQFVDIEPIQICGKVRENFRGVKIESALLHRVMNRLLMEAEVDEEVLDSFKPKGNLEPKFFTDKKIDPQIKNKLLKIAKDFKNMFDFPFVIEDITLTGSLANYNWSRYSDVDLHVIVDFDAVDENTELVKEAFGKASAIWNNQHDIFIEGYEVEIYVQNLREPHHSTGVYSLEDDRWIKEPGNRDQEYVPSEVKRQAKLLIKRIDHIEKLVEIEEYDEALEAIERLKRKIKRMRQSGLASQGEYSPENLAFKVLRRMGQLERINNLRFGAYDKLMSLDEG